MLKGTLNASQLASIFRRHQDFSKLVINYSLLLPDRTENMKITARKVLNMLAPCPGEEGGALDGPMCVENRSKSMLDIGTIGCASCGEKGGDQVFSFQ